MKFESAAGGAGGQKSGREEYQAVLDQTKGIREELAYEGTNDDRAAELGTKLGELKSEKDTLHAEAWQQAIEENVARDMENMRQAADAAEAEEPAKQARAMELSQQIQNGEIGTNMKETPAQTVSEAVGSATGPSKKDLEDAYLINQLIDKRSEYAEKGIGKMPSIKKVEAKSMEEIDVLTEMIRTEAGRAYLADEIPAIANPERSASQPSATETAPMTVETVPAQESNSDKSSLQNIPVPIFRAPQLSDSFSAAVYEKNAIKEASGGLIEYVPGTQKRLERGESTGYLFEGKSTIPAERLPELKSMLAQAERAKSAEAFEYARLSDSDPDANLIGAERMKNLSLDDKKGFEMALSRKKYANEKAQKKVLISGATAALATYISGLGAIVLGSSAAGGLIFVAFPAVAGAGALAYVGKKIFDWNKEKKAEKNFMAASVARQANQSI